MDFTLSIILFFVGFYILVKGAQILVRGAVSAAHVFGLSKWFIGIAIVSVGTSMPELSINLASVFDGEIIGISAIIGSNVFNSLVILGLASFITPIIIRGSWRMGFWINLATITIAASIILFPVLGDPYFVGITRPEALLLFGLFLGWMTMLLMRPEYDTESADEEVFTVFVSVALILFGVLGVFVGGQWVVDGAEAMALYFGVSEALIGLTIVAIGTSLPEFTVSIVAAWKRNPSIALGNIMGANIFGLFGILGATALIHPIAVMEDFRMDILAAGGAAVLLLLMLYLGKRYTLTRVEGTLLVLAYIIYLVVLFLRG
jgi:cation:H+ antiporter